jgi:hypothetical protein
MEERTKAISKRPLDFFDPQARGFTTMAELNTSPTEILCGAWELALLSAHWQSDRSAQQTGIRHIYAVDVDILNFYSNPRRNAHYASIVGLMPEESVSTKNGALLGLAEMLGRYFFRAQDTPAILLEANYKEFSRIFEIVESKYLSELSTTVGNIDFQKRVVGELIAAYHKSPNKSARDFVAIVAEQLEKALPALYEPYNAIREMSRWAPLIDEENPRLLPAERVCEIAEALESRFDNSCRLQELCWTEVLAAWHNAIGGRADEDLVNDQSYILRRDADADAMAQVEWINRWFQHKNAGCRLMYVTGAPRLYAAALERFKVLPNSSVHKPTFGSRRQLAIGRYLAFVKPEGDLNKLDKLNANWAPLRDVRSFMVDPDFVDFSENGALDELALSTQALSTEADLTKWLNLFLSGTRDQFLEASEGYKILHDLRPSRLRSGDRLSESDFQPEAFDALTENWSRFSKRVAAAHAIERGTRRTAREFISEVFKGGNAIQLLGNALDQEMEEVLQNVGAVTILREKSETYFHSMPPLVFSRFPEVEQIILEEISSKNVRSIISARLNAIEEIIESLVHTDSQKKYLSLLTKAMLFGSTGSWGACLAFASQAYAVARIPKSSPSDASYEPVTGREAAYLCHYAVRKRVANSSWWRVECQRWSNLWAAALRSERGHFELSQKPYFSRFHQIRFLVEGDALDLALHFSQCAEYGEVSQNSRISEPSVPIDIFEELRVIIAKANREDLGLIASVLFVANQASVNQIQRLIVFTDKSSDSLFQKVKSYVDVFEEFESRRTTEFGLMASSSLFDRYVLACAMAVLNRTPKPDSVERPKIAMAYDEWKFGRLERGADL